VATIRGFDHYGLDRALWLGLPGLAKWSRNGMAPGRQRSRARGDRRQRLRAVVLMHDNDPIGALSPDLLVKRPPYVGPALQRESAIRGTANLVDRRAVQGPVAGILDAFLRQETSLVEDVEQGEARQHDDRRQHDRDQHRRQCAGG
jgi:hypothetical protein